MACALERVLMLRCCTWLTTATLSVVVLVVGCGPSYPRQYLEQSAAAKHAFAAGRYDEAARAYRNAAHATTREKDRDEMLFMEAATLERARKWTEASVAYGALEQLSPTGDRAARSAHQRALIELEHGDRERGYNMLERVFKAYPSSGLARGALAKTLSHMDEVAGPDATVKYLNDNLAWFKVHQLGEFAMYETAKRLERRGDMAAARDAYVACARAYPYPKGGLFDDALYRASVLDEKLGHFDRAVQELEHMLSFRETSTLNGSYERPRYSAAQLRIARLYRDRLSNPKRARQEFRKLFTDFSTSTSRDNALWEEAELAKQMGDMKGACDAAHLLIKTLPDSRYVACVRLVCPSAPVPATDRECPEYALRHVGSSDDAESSPDGDKDIPDRTSD